MPTRWSFMQRSRLAVPLNEGGGDLVHCALTGRIFTDSSAPGWSRDQFGTAPDFTGSEDIVLKPVTIHEMMRSPDASYWFLTLFRCDTTSGQRDPIGGGASLRNGISCNRNAPGGLHYRAQGNAVEIAGGFFTDGDVMLVLCQSEGTSQPFYMDAWNLTQQKRGSASGANSGTSDGDQVCIGRRSDGGGGAFDGMIHYLIGGPGVIPRRVIDHVWQDPFGWMYREDVDVAKFGAPATVGLTPDSLTHAHSIEAAALTQANAITPAALAHGHPLDATSLTQAHSIAPAELAHGHPVEAVGLTQAHAISPAELVHAHPLEAPGLTQAHSISPAELLHAHALAAAALTQAHQLAPAELLHAHGLDPVSLTQAHILVPAELTHTHGLEQVTLSLSTPVNPADLQHSHPLAASALTQAHVIIPAELLHAHGLDPAALTQAHVLVPAGLLHGHLLDAAVLVIPGEVAVVLSGDVRLVRSTAGSVRLVRGTTGDAYLTRDVQGSVIV